MKLTIQNRNLPVGRTLDTLIEARLLTLARRVQIDDATVLVERRAEASPAFRVALHLAVPGPDFRAEFVDHTAMQAFTRAFAEIERRLRERSRHRLGREGARAPHGSARSGRTSRVG